MIHGGALGDFIMSLRVVEAIRQFGVTRISILGRPAISNLAKLCGVVDDVRDIETSGFHRLFTCDGTLSDENKAWLARFHIAVNMLAGGDSTLSAQLRSAGICMVIDIDPAPQKGQSAHITDQWLSGISTLLPNSDIGAPRLEVPQSLRSEASAILHKLPLDAKADPILIHPGSGGRSKCWPLEQFLSLARQLRSKRIQPIFVLGPVELERLSQVDQTAIRSNAPTIENPSLPLLAGLLAEVGRFVGNDSGVSHLAAAVGTHTTAIFITTDPSRWRPMGPHVRIVTGTKPSEAPGAAQVLEQILSHTTKK